MFIDYKIVNAAKKVRGLTCPEKSVLYALALNLERGKESVYISYTLLVEEAGGNKNTIIRAVKELIALGFIEEEETNREGIRKGYRFDLEMLGFPAKDEMIEALGDLGDLGDLGERPKIHRGRYTPEEKLARREKSALAVLGLGESK